MHPREGLRERKKNETSRAITAAALDLAMAKGPGSITVEDIAAAAGVSARTLFNYFPTKEAAILGIDTERRRDFVTRIESRPAEEPPLEAIHAAVRAHFTPELAEPWRCRASLSRDHPHLHSAYLASFASFEDDLIDAIARRTGLDPTVEVYPRLLVVVATSTIRVAVGRALLDPGATSITRCLDEAFALLAGGLAVPPPSHPNGTHPC